MDSDATCQSCQIFLVLYIVLVIAIIAGIIWLISYIKNIGNTIDDTIKGMTGILPRNAGVVEPESTKCHPIFSDFNNACARDVNKDTVSQNVYDSDCFIGMARAKCVPKQESESGSSGSGVGSVVRNIENNIRTDATNAVNQVTNALSFLEGPVRNISQALTGGSGTKETFKPQLDMNKEEKLNFINWQVDDMAYWMFKHLDERRPTEWNAECESYANA